MAYLLGFQRHMGLVKHVVRLMSNTCWYNISIYTKQEHRIMSVTNKRFVFVSFYYPYTCTSRFSNLPVDMQYLERKKKCTYKKIWNKEIHQRKERTSTSFCHPKRKQTNKKRKNEKTNRNHITSNSCKIDEAISMMSHFIGWTFRK